MSKRLESFHYLYFVERVPEGRLGVSSHQYFCLLLSKNIVWLLPELDRFASLNMSPLFKSPLKANRLAFSPAQNKNPNGFHFVPEGRLELPSLARHDFESCVYTNSTTPAVYKVSVAKIGL